MAKQAATATKTADAPPAPAPSFVKANTPAEATAEVVKWGNGEAVSEHVDPAMTEPASADEAAKPTETKPAETEEKPPAEGEPETAEDPKPVEDAKPGVDPERRKQIIASLAAERAKRDMEGQIAAAKKEAEEAKTARAEFEKLPLAQKLALVAKSHGMSVQDLADRLLINGEDVQDSPSAARAPDPEVAALKATVTALTERLQKQDATAERQSVERAVGMVRTQLKDVDLPMVDSFDAYDRIMVRAHEAWQAGGRQGSPSDFVPDVAPDIEAELKAEHPRAAARLYPKKTETEEAHAEPAAEPAAGPTPRVAVGKRTAARPDAKPKSLWEGGRTTAEVDALIKKELGWS